jgi:hypothetical protein
MTLKKYYEEKEKTLVLCVASLLKINKKSRIELAYNLNVSISTLNCYMYGTGRDFEMALIIIDRLKSNK